MINLTYNPSVVHVTGVTGGDFGLDVYNFDNSLGLMTANTINLSGMSGNLVFAYINLTAVGSKGDSCILDITVDQLINNNYETIPHAVTDGSITIKGTTDTDSTSGGGGGSSSGAGVSGEDFNNIIVSETERNFLSTGSNVSYSFDSTGNIIRYINFTALKNSGTIAAKVEILKNTSTLVDHTPPDTVYQNLNIWLGNTGWSNSDNIADPVINFEVEKSWVSANNIDISTIKMYRYDSGKWEALDTSLEGQDSVHLYLVAKTPGGFSPFAVIGNELAGEAGAGGIEGSTDTEVVTEQTPDQQTARETQTEEKPGIPGFGLFIGVSVLLIAVQILHKRGRVKD